MGTVTASLLFIRKDASTNYSAIGMLRKGERVQVLETSGNWLKIQQGWVYSAYVKMDNGSTVYDNEKTNVIVTVNSLNIRETPSLLGKVVGSLSRYQKVEVLETNGDWIRTNYGWVHKSYVKLVSAASANNTGTVKASALNIRSGPGTNYDKLGVLRQGETVTILENKGGWYRISSGWVSANYIKIGG
jgi:N-acetylmuramoyl-L-alanine amidase